MKLSYGLLFRTCMLMNVLDSSPQSERDILGSFGGTGYRNVDVSLILEIARQASWVVEAKDGKLHVSNDGKSLVAIASDELRLRKQITTLIRLDPPYWVGLAMQGRQAAIKYLDIDTLQCLREAGLVSGYDSDVIGWWDSLAAMQRSEEDSRKLEVGRKGERYSYKMEYLRTGKWPDWTALEYADAGYDLVSRVSSNNDDRLVIEVKTSKSSWRKAIFHLSRHEWETLIHEKSSVIHLWSFGQQELLHASIVMSQLEPHVPFDKGGGGWRVMTCPFIEFDPLQIDETRILGA